MLQQLLQLLLLLLLLFLFFLFPPHIFQSFLVAFHSGPHDGLVALLCVVRVPGRHRGKAHHAGYHEQRTTAGQSASGATTTSTATTFVVVVVALGYMRWLPRRRLAAAVVVHAALCSRARLEANGKPIIEDCTVLGAIQPQHLCIDVSADCHVRPTGNI